MPFRSEGRACLCSPLGVLLRRSSLAAVTVSAEFKHNPVFGPQNAAVWGTLLNLAWMMCMDIVYGWLATAINDLENHRTESIYDNQLILKTAFFQFINSYFALFYLAFIKASSPATSGDLICKRRVHGSQRSSPPPPHHHHHLAGVSHHPHLGLIRSD